MIKMLKIAIAKGRVAEKVSELLLDTVDYRNIILMFPYMWEAEQLM